MAPSRLWPLTMLTSMAVAYVLLPYSVWSGLLYVAIGASVTALLAVAWRRRPLDQRSAWLLLALGVGCWVSGDAIWFVLDHLGHRGFPSFADAAYLAAYPLWWIAFGRISRASRASRGELVDAAIVSVAIGVVAWTVVLGPSIADPSLANLARWTTVAYTVGDMLLVVLIAVSVLTQRAHKPDHLLLASAIVVFLATNLVYTHGELTETYAASGVFDLGWLATYVLFVTAAWHPSATQEPAASIRNLTVSNLRLAMLAAAALLAPVVMFVHADQDPLVRRIASIATMGIVLLVIDRIAGLNRNIGMYVETLEELAQTDPLTGALNRRQLDLDLAREVARAERTASPLAIALFDLDHFKKFNDTYGHAEGDLVLQEMVEAWKSAVREFDAVTRYGGEEFVVVFPSTTIADAIHATERLRAAVPRDQTVSAGIAAYQPGDTPDVLIRRADRALYCAKHAGRDRTVVASDSPPELGDQLTAEDDHQEAPPVSPEPERNAPRSHQ